MIFWWMLWSLSYVLISYSSLDLELAIAIKWKLVLIFNSTLERALWTRGSNHVEKCKFSPFVEITQQNRPQINVMHFLTFMMQSKTANLQIIAYNTLSLDSKIMTRHVTSRQFWGCRFHSAVFNTCIFSSPLNHTWYCTSVYAQWPYNFILLNSWMI